MSTTNTPWRSHRKLGPQPLCGECHREEVSVDGGVCMTCRNRLAYQKKSAAEKLKAAHEIAERLYKLDAVKYKDVFGFINKSLKRGHSLLQILHAVEALERQVKIILSEPGESKGLPPAGDVFAYLSGTLRRLEEKSQAGKLRGGASSLGGIMARSLGLSEEQLKEVIKEKRDD